MMVLVQQQQALLSKQKSAHDANQRQARQLQDQRQQLETALRQNSVLQSQNKVVFLLLAYCVDEKGIILDRVCSVCNGWF